MSKNLTPKFRAMFLKIIILRDGLFGCFYCHKEFLSLRDYVFEHLNNNRADNRVDNLVLACSTCNNKKPHDFDMQINATEKLHLNEISNYMREIPVDGKQKKEELSEIQISFRNYEIAKLWLIQEIDSKEHIIFTVALNAISYECREQTGHGSPQSVRGYINTLTSIAAPFEIVKNEDGKKIIRRKKSES